MNYLSKGPTEGQPDPPKMMVKLIRTAMRKKNIPMEQLDKLAKLMSFELWWWQDRGWLGAKSFQKLASIPVPAGFDVEDRLL